VRKSKGLKVIFSVLNQISIVFIIKLNTPNFKFKKFENKLIISQILVSIRYRRNTEGPMLHSNMDRDNIIQKAFSSSNILATNIQCYSIYNLSLNLWQMKLDFALLFMKKSTPKKINFKYNI